MDKQTYYYGTGRRKTATARVKLTTGNGTIIIDGIPIEKRFPSIEHQRVINQPFLTTESTGKYNAVIKVAGGGVSGQSGAISHGISRALVRSDERFKALLRAQGLLTRDARAKERKKPGLKRARKAPQYTKR
jgi:small subunit ribosomal protein S9